jgi:hypothetical protein
MSGPWSQNNQFETLQESERFLAQSAGLWLEQHKLIEAHQITNCDREGLSNMTDPGSKTPLDIDSVEVEVHQMGNPFGDADPNADLVDFEESDEEEHKLGEESPERKEEGEIEAVPLSDEGVLKGNPPNIATLEEKPSSTMLISNSDTEWENARGNIHNRGCSYPWMFIPVGCRIFGM